MIRLCGRIVCWFSVAVTAVLLIVLFTPLVPHTATGMAIDWYDGDADVLVVLVGSSVYLNSQTLLGEDSYLRTLYACARLSARRSRYVIVSGTPGAGAMSQLLRCQCPGQFEIIEDDASHSTRESAVRVQQIVQQLPGPKHVVILTSDYHSFRAARAFHRVGLPVRTEPVPDIAKRSSSRLYRVQGFGALVIEMVKIADYWLHGWI